MTAKQTDALPKHVAIIMDGNGRFAKSRGLPRVAGHQAGVETVKRVVKHALKRGLRILTLFAFSSENWRRPSFEVSYIMDLFLQSLQREASELHAEGISLKFIGDRTRLSAKLCRKMHDVEVQTEKNNRLILQFAIDYGGQWDICQATRAIAKRVEQGELASHEITQDLIRSSLSFAALPDPDLFIRTSGEMRISNFMLWQLAYTELYFTPIYWPNFDEVAFDEALSHYALRERRFGLVLEDS